MKTLFNHDDLLNIVDNAMESIQDLHSKDHDVTLEEVMTKLKSDGYDCNHKKIKKIFREIKESDKIWKAVFSME